jgi:hypothetical protein
MDVSEHLRRELIYELNAALLRGETSPAALATAFVETAEREGPRFHEPDLMGAWAEAVATDPDELRDDLEDTIALVIEELDDDEAPWSAHRLLDLLAEEPFWCITWGIPGDPLPAPVRAARSAALPLALRVSLVRLLDHFELRIHELQQDQRSVHDPVPPRELERALDELLHDVDLLAEQFRKKDGVQLHGALALGGAGKGLPSLRSALRTIQGWKTSVEFDASPDDDDGEWTLRVLERLYRLAWVVG